MNKREVIAKTLSEFYDESSKDGTSFAPIAAPESQIFRALRASLGSVSDDADLMTCLDFSELGAECCLICHTSYPHYDMALVKMEVGRPAWVCCAIQRALNQERADEAEIKR